MNFFFIKQSGYGDKYIFYKIFSFIIIEKFFSIQCFHFWKPGFVIFITGATETDFFEIGWWNYMTMASKLHIPFLWRIFLRLGSSSSCCEQLLRSRVQANKKWRRYLKCWKQIIRIIQLQIILLLYWYVLDMNINMFVISTFNCWRLEHSFSLQGLWFSADA